MVCMRVVLFRFFAAKLFSEASKEKNIRGKHPFSIQNNRRTSGKHPFSIQNNALEGHLLRSLSPKAPGAGIHPQNSLSRRGEVAAKQVVEEVAGGCL